MAGKTKNYTDEFKKQSEFLGALFITRKRRKKLTANSKMQL